MHAFGQLDGNTMIAHQTHAEWYTFRPGFATMVTDEWWVARLLDARGFANLTDEGKDNTAHSCFGLFLCGRQCVHAFFVQKPTMEGFFRASVHG